MSEGKFVTHKHHVDMGSRHGEVVLYPFSDVHRFSQACDVGAWTRFLKKARAELDANPKTLFLCLGDSDDMLSRKERRWWLCGELHDQSREEIDEYVRKKLDVLVEELRFMTGHLIGFVPGNHYWQFADGSTSDDYVARRLKAPVLGDLSYILLLVNVGRSGAERIDIVAHHGRAGGKLVGTSISQVDDLRKVFPTADLYLMGHDHQRGAWPTSTLDVLDNRRPGKPPRLRQKRQYLCRTGSFLRAYEPGKASYLVHKIVRASDLGTIRIGITMSRSSFRNGPDRSDITRPHIEVTV